MPPVTPLELEHCKELAILPGSLFEFTSRYIPVTRQQQLTALYALTQSLALIPDAVTDDAVKWAKLKWWSEELAAEPSSPSRHPVLRALWQSGARQHLNNDLLQRLVSDAVAQLDIVPDANEQAMYERLAARRETGVLLELALDGAEINTLILNKLAAASAMFAMIADFFVDHQSKSLCLPLDLLAQYQLTANQLEQEPPQAELLEVISHLTDSGIEWFSQGLPGLDASPGMHICLRWAMEARLLARFSKNVDSNLRRRYRFGPSDAWFAWRYCQKFRRRW